MGSEPTPEEPDTPAIPDKYMFSPPLTILGHNESEKHFVALMFREILYLKCQREPEKGETIKIIKDSTWDHVNLHGPFYYFGKDKNSNDQCLIRDSNHSQGRKTGTLFSVSIKNIRQDRNVPIAPTGNHNDLYKFFYDTAEHTAYEEHKENNFISKPMRRIRLTPYSQQRD